jgi:hypothetical protein
MFLLLCNVRHHCLVLLRESEPIGPRNVGTVRTFLGLACQPLVEFQMLLRLGRQYHSTRNS